MNRNRVIAISFVVLVLALIATRMTIASENPLDMWAKAVGGRDKVAGITAIYREATIEVAGYAGTIKAWHTFDGRYRKEEQVADYGNIEVFDGVGATVQQAGTAPQKLAGADLQRARSTAFANSNAMFFAFFPERQHGTAIIDDKGIVLRADGGIDWRVVLDPQTSLPATMTHQEGPRTVVVTFVSYETVDGMKFEKEIHRSNGDPRFDSIIRFTKTVINPEIDASVFSINRAY
jgi:hypothetical protein